ncbi:MAG: RodZ domain-containing protein [candidate division NC10 bacterium]
MGELGGYLRELREAGGASLDEMARATRVGKRHLQALEAEELTELPAPVFVKGFIRAYCGFLQVPADEALSRYRALLGEAHPAQRTATARASAPVWRGGPLVVSFVLLVLLAGTLLAVNVWLRGSPEKVASRPEPSAVRAEPVANLQPAPQIAASGIPSTQPPAAAPSATSPGGSAAPLPRGSQRLVVRALEPTWIKVQMDGGGSVQELLPAGATREWSAEKRFVLTVGNAGGLQLELNGRALPPLGERGAVIRELVLPQGGAAGGS